MAIDLAPEEVGHIAVRTETGGAWPPGLFRRVFEIWMVALTAMPSAMAGTIPAIRPGKMQDGYLWFVGRADDLISSAGYRISPFEVESALLEHPAVMESAVVGHPDPTRGQVVKAFIILADGRNGSPALAEEIQDFLQGPDGTLQISARHRIRERIAENDIRQNPAGGASGRQRITANCLPHGGMRLRKSVHARCICWGSVQQTRITNQ